MISTIVLCLAMQGWYGSGKKFDGFVPTPQTAIEVAAPLFKAALGEEWVRLASPLKAELILNRWIVRGTHNTNKKKEDDLIVEPFFIAIDRWSARVSLFGPPHLMDIRKELSKVPYDGAKPVKGKQKNARGGQ